MNQKDDVFVLNNFETALNNGHFIPYFQPIIRTLTGEVCAAESLAR